MRIISFLRTFIFIPAEEINEKFAEKEKTHFKTEKNFDIMLIFAEMNIGRIF